MHEAGADKAQSAAEAELDGLTASVRRVLETRSDVAFAYLFGSFAKGTAGSDSDVDLGVLLEPEQDHPGTGSRTDRALELEAELERTLGRPVQVVDLDAAPPGLVQNVLRTGELVCRPDRAAHARFYVAHANRYFDMAPARAIFDRYRARRIEEGSFGGRDRHRT